MLADPLTRSITGIKMSQLIHKFIFLKIKKKNKKKKKIKNKKKIYFFKKKKKKKKKKLYNT